MRLLVTVISYTSTPIFWSSSTGLLENLTLLDNKVEDNEFDELTNWIIKELDLTAIAIMNNKVSSLGDNKANKMDEILTKSKNIRNHQIQKKIL